jgi:hypothetical protein
MDPRFGVDARVAKYPSAAVHTLLSKYVENLNNATTNKEFTTIFIKFDILLSLLGDFTDAAYFKTELNKFANRAHKMPKYSKIKKSMEISAEFIYIVATLYIIQTYKTLNPRHCMRCNEKVLKLLEADFLFKEDIKPIYVEQYKIAFS